MTRSAAAPTSMLVVGFLAACSADGPTALDGPQVLTSVKDVSANATQVTYSYLGNAFDLFSCGGSSLCSTPNPSFTSYTTSNQVTAVLTLDSALPPGLTLHNVRGLPGFSLTMGDGIQVLSLDPGVPGEALVSTDANGDIIAPWSMIRNCCSFPNNFVFSVNWPGVRGVADGGGLSAPTGSFPNTPRDQGQVNGNPGVWTTQQATPEQRIDDLGDAIDALVGSELNTGQANGLTRPLQNAARSLAAGRTAAACSQLQDFIGEVGRKTPPLSPQSSAALVAEAVAIQLAIGC